MSESFSCTYFAIVNDKTGKYASRDGGFVVGTNHTVMLFDLQEHADQALAEVKEDHPRTSLSVCRVKITTTTERV